MNTSLEIGIEGMTCDGCVRSVTRALEKVDGVQSVQVSLERRRATVAFDDTKTSAGSLRHAIEAAGFDVPATAQ